MRKKLTFVIYAYNTTWDSCRNYPPPNYCLERIGTGRSSYYPIESSLVPFKIAAYNSDSAMDIVKKAIKRDRYSLIEVLALAQQSSESTTGEK